MWQNNRCSIVDFAEKQHFLNTVYERIFQGFSVKVAGTHGIVYTPQEIVDHGAVAKFRSVSPLARISDR